MNRFDEMRRLVQTELLLDLYPNNVYAAWSVARKLRDGYSGSAIQVRNTTTNALIDIGFSFSLLNESYLSSQIGAGGATVKILYGQGISGINLVQVNNAIQPTIVSGGSIIKSNNKPYIKFANNYLISTLAQTPIFDKNSTFYIVFESQAETVISGLFEEVVADLTPSNQRIVVYSDTTISKNHSNYAATSPTGNLTLNFSAQQPQSTRRIFAIRKSGGTVYAYDETGLVASGAYSLSFLEDTIFQMGRQQAGPLYFNGKIAEAIVYSEAHNDITRNAIINNMKSFYH
jgi:hypothetical protein